MKPRLLIPISGGIDSSYVAYKQLLKSKQEGEEILLLHLDIISLEEPRYLAERNAVHNVLDWFRSVDLTNFKYVHMGFNYGTVSRVTLKDIQVVAFACGALLKSREFSSVNTISLPWHKGEVAELEQDKGKRFLKVLESTGVDRKINLEFPIETLTKRDIVEDLPLCLLKLTHSCRYSSTACGHCKTCKEVKEAVI